MIEGDIVRRYLNPREYITGVIVEDCGDCALLGAFGVRLKWYLNIIRGIRKDKI